MQPVARRNPTQADVSPAQDFLTDRRDHDGVNDVVVSRVTGRDVLQRQLGYKTYDARKSRLQRTVGTIVHPTKFADEGGNDDLRGIEHRLILAHFGKGHSKDF